MTYGDALDQLRKQVAGPVLAAGEGSRMRSSRPKPLHLLCGRAMVLYVLDALPTKEVDRAVVVVGHGAERVTKKLMEAAGVARRDITHDAYGREIN